jgi:hypothetical protein
MGNYILKNSSEIDDGIRSLSAPPRKRGRPKGLSKTGGRQKGVKNWTGDEMRNALLDKSDAVEVLADICAGRELLCSGPTGKEIWRRPTLPERLQAAQTILRKILPDLAATELKGEENTPIQIVFGRLEQGVL